MIKEVIQDFRKQNNRPLAQIDHYEENQNCLWHCYHMTTQELCHAPEYLRQRDGYILSEACAYMSFAHNPDETLCAIIFKVLAESPKHRKILLESNNIACASHMDFMTHNIFVTVRGW